MAGPALRWARHRSSAPDWQRCDQVLAATITAAVIGLLATAVAATAVRGS